MTDIQPKCEVCGERFQPNDIVTHVEKVYFTRDSRAETGNHFLAAHVNCPKEQA